ncbi:hypothetical protein C8Q70DRAFT_1020623, partial [Cubamyces menziesii]
MDDGEKHLRTPVSILCDMRMNPIYVVEFSLSGSKHKRQLEGATSTNLSQQIASRLIELSISCANSANPLPGSMRGRKCECRLEQVYMPLSSCSAKPMTLPGG